MARLSAPLARLLDDCRSEAKRWNSPDAGLLHLAYVLARKAPEEFTERFGADGSDRIETLLRSGGAHGVDGPELLALLEAAPRENATGHLLAALAGCLPEVTESAASEEVTVDRDGHADVEDAAVGEGADAAPAPWSVPQRTARYLELVVPDTSVIDNVAVVDDVLAHIGRRVPVTPLVTAASGAGRTSLIISLANRLSDPDYSGPLAGAPVLRVRPDAIVGGDRANALRRILEDLEDEVVVVIDDLEVVAGLGGSGADLDSLGVVRAALEDAHARVVLTIDRSYTSRLGVHSPELAEEVEEVELVSPDRPTLTKIVEQVAIGLSAHHSVELPASITHLALAPPATGDRREHPGLAVDRLDGACARAAIRPERRVVEGDLRFSATPEIAAPDAQELEARLGERVLGQRGAVLRVAQRLALTRAELDLRPSRPDGVFLFVGPTGVGKTELARAIAAELCGGPDDLIRLDMSEYAHDWALSRLVGPQPGYVGFTEPDGWLTTRVRAKPQAVLLLDEIEKAHPTIWNAFLQVFDAGRLSDARGAVADFGKVIVCMTSNLGAESFSSAPVGFGQQGDRRGQDVQRVVDAVRATMSPELVNRLDDIIVFEPLDRAAIHTIAEKEVEAAVGRLRDRGYVITIDDAVVDLLAATGHDPAYGARHLQRNVERLLLQPLASMRGRELHASVAAGVVQWDERSMDEGT